MVAHYILWPIPLSVTCLVLFKIEAQEKRDRIKSLIGTSGVLLYRKAQYTSWFLDDSGPIWRVLELEKESEFHECTCCSR
jgi:hypothetical protein